MEEVKEEIIQEEDVFVDQAVITHNQVNFIIDAKTVLPRFGLDGKMNAKIIKHNTLRFNPAIFKEFIKVMIDNLRTYEKTYGEIKVEVK